MAVSFVCVYACLSVCPTVLNRELLRVLADFRVGWKRRKILTLELLRILVYVVKFFYIDLLSTVELQVIKDP